MSEWQDIGPGIRYGTIADLLMASGRVYRAVWEYRGDVCAWWPESRQRKSPIGLYTPLKMRVAAAGLIPAHDWRRASGHVET